MLRWFSSRASALSPSHITQPGHDGLVVSTDEANDSDVSLLITSDNDGTTADSTTPTVDQNSQSSVRPAGQLPNIAVESDMPPIVVTGSTSNTRGHDDSSRRRRRHHHRHHRSSSSRRRDRHQRAKNDDSNYFAAVFNLVVVVLISIAIFEPRWLYVQGGRCSMSYLGIKTFFNPVATNSEVLVDCVTSDAVAVMRVIIALCFLVLISSLMACVLDTVGSSRVLPRMLQSTASFSILSACVCIVITGMCYVTTQQLSEFYESHRFHRGSRVIVDFDMGFYMITAAGAVSVLAVGCTLLCLRISSTSRSSRSLSHDTLFDIFTTTDQQRLLDSGVRRLNQAASSGCVTSLPPAPPPYRP